MELLPLHGKFSGLYKLKVGAYRVIYELNQAEKIITVHKIGHSGIFINTVGKKIGTSWVMKHFIIARKKAGLDDFHFHDLRHCFATRLAQRGVDLYTISKLYNYCQ